MNPTTSLAAILLALTFSTLATNHKLNTSRDPYRGNLNEKDAHIALNGYAVTNPPGVCNGSWVKTHTGESKNKRVTLRLDYNQYPDGPYNITTLKVSVAVKKKKFGIWVNATADEIRVTGEFAGPRSPRDQSGNYGYSQPNPFNVNYSSPITHFTDYSATSLDCYSMSAATYTATAYFSGDGTSSTISW